MAKTGMVYREYPCSPGLREYISCYWQYTRHVTPAEPEKVLPDGFVELIFQRGKRYRDGDVELPAAVAIGILDRPLVLTAAGRVDQWCVRFRPWGVTPFGDVRATIGHDWLNGAAVFDAALLAGLDVAAGTEPDAEVPRLFDQVLLSSLLAWTADDQTLRAAGHILRERGGAVLVSDLAAACRVSRRQLERDFDSRIGRAPRDVASRMRFEYARRLLATDPGRSLAAVAVSAGYVDQSHLTRAFHDFAGMTPRQFVFAVRQSVESDEVDVAFIQDYGVPRLPTL